MNKWNFFQKYKLELVCTKNYSTLAKTFLLNLFKRVAIQTKCSGLEQSSFSKFLMPKQWKQCEEKCVMHTEKHVFVKSVYKLIKCRLPTTSQCKKKQSIEWKHTYFPEKSFWHSDQCRRLYCTDSLLGHERTYHYWFSWKRVKL